MIPLSTIKLLQKPAQLWVPAEWSLWTKIPAWSEWQNFSSISPRKNPAENVSIAALEQSGCRVGMFTSPHLVDVRERFVIDGEMISKEAFLQAFLTVYDNLNWEELETGKGYHPTFFEFLFFMAMLIFKEEAPDYCILETGLGGRLDATNAVERKKLAVITRISLEHVEYLGHTIAEIAGEKAGIMKVNTPVVFSDVVEEATEVFCEKSRKMSAPCYPVSKKDYTFLNFKNKSIDFSYVSRYDYSIKMHLNTIAAYQVENCALALRAMEVLDEERNLTPQILAKGVEQCFWAGRMEEVAPEIFVHTMQMVSEHFWKQYKGTAMTDAGSCYSVWYPIRIISLC